jgi:8-hydroxy-5-deazaflavin:NADPH oxidoreductase
VDIAIIGAGNIGGTLGRLWVQAGHRVVFGVRKPQALQGLLSELGDAAHAGPPGEATRSADTVVFAGPYGAWPEFARAQLDALKGKTVVDAANPTPRAMAPSLRRLRTWAVARAPTPRTCCRMCTS